MIQLHEHQLKALGEMKNGCILKGGVGVGKSPTALAYFFTQECGGSLRVNGEGWTEPLTTPKDLYIITTAKKRNELEWEGEAAKFALSTRRDISYGGVKVTVDSWNNIINYKEVKDAFFIFDEQRLVGSGAWVKAFLEIAKSNNWIMLSATPGDNWMDYVPVFIANGYYKNRTEFIHEHVVYNTFAKFAKIDRYVGEAKLEKLRWRLIVDMPFDRHTIRHLEQIRVAHNEGLFKSVREDRWNPYKEKPIKDVSEWFSVMRKVVNSDHSRMDILLEKLELHNKLIVFYNFDYELEIMREGLKDVEHLQVAEYNGHKHQEVPGGPYWVYLVQYTAGAEGWNCTATDAMLFWSLNYSWKINEQARGRIDRMNTPFVDLYYYVLRSNAWIDTLIWKAIVLKRRFNEKVYDPGDWDLAA